MQISVSKRSKVMPAKPADRIIELTISGPDIEKGPGPQWTSSVSSCDTTGTISRTRKFRLVQPGIVLALAPDDCVNVPPGFSALRMLRIAAPGRMKNMVPKRAKAWS